MPINNNNHFIIPGRNAKSRYLPDNIKIICELEKIAIFEGSEPLQICDLDYLNYETIIAISILYTDAKVVVFTEDKKKFNKLVEKIDEYNIENICLNELEAIDKGIDFGEFDLIFAGINDLKQDKVLSSSEEKFVSKYLKNMGALVIGYDAGIHTKITFLISEFLNSILLKNEEGNREPSHGKVEKIARAILSRQSWKINKLGYINENLRRARNHASKSMSPRATMNFSDVKRQIESLGLKYVAQSDHKVNIQKSFIQTDLSVLIHGDGGMDELIDFLLLNRKRIDIYVRNATTFQNYDKRESVGIYLKKTYAESFVLDTVAGKQRIAEKCSELMLKNAKDHRYKLSDFTRDLGEGSRNAREYFKKFLATDQFIAGYRDVTLDILEPGTNLRYTTEDKKIIGDCRALKSGFQIISPKIRSQIFSFGIEETAILDAFLGNLSATEIESLIKTFESNDTDNNKYMDQYNSRTSIIRRFVGI